MIALLAAAAWAQDVPAHVAHDRVLTEIHTNTGDVRDLHWDGHRLWAATAGGVEAWRPDGTRDVLITGSLPSVSAESIGQHQGDLVVGLTLRGAWDLDAMAPALQGFEDRDTVVGMTGDALVTRGGTLAWRGGSIELGGPAVDVVEWGQGVLVATQAGWLHHVVDGDLNSTEVPCPITDLAVDGDQVRVACLMDAYVLDAQGLERQGVAATAAAQGAWGLVDGTVLTEEGVLTRVPGRVTALEQVGAVWFIGTQDGLYRLDADLRRVTPEGQICGNFVTGAVVFQEQLLVTTFQDGACTWDGDRWVDLPESESTLFNDVVVGDDGRAWLASSGGLLAWDGDALEAVGVIPYGHRGKAGTQHPTVTALAQGDRLWMTDLVGPVSVDQGYWRRHRLQVFGTSYQAVAAKGAEAWVASEDAGVSHWTGRRWEHFDGTSGLPDDWVMAVACAGPGQAWAGTYRDGTWFYDGLRWTQVPGVDDWTLSLAAEGDGVWIGTLDGVYGVTPEQTIEVWSPDPRVHQLTVSEGLLLVGSENGLAVYE